MPRDVAGPTRPLLPPVPAALPPDGAGPGQWNAYVADGETREIRRERLAQCPPEYRERVESHVKTVFALRRQQAERIRQAKEAERLKRPHLQWEPDNG